MEQGYREEEKQRDPENPYLDSNSRKTSSEVLAARQKVTECKNEGRKNESDVVLGAVGSTKQSENKNDSTTENKNERTDKKRRREKRPEMARYQPPGSRASTSSAPASVASRLEESFDSLELNEKNNHSLKKNEPVLNTVKSQNEEIVSRKNDSEIKRIENKEQKNKQKSNKPTNISSRNKKEEFSDEEKVKPANVNIIKESSGKSVAIHGGLLKLNQSTLNELIAQNEREQKQQLSQLDNKNEELLEGRNKETSLNVSVKMLYDPNNPNKPILVQQKFNNDFHAVKSSANRNEQRQSFNKSELSSVNESSRNTSSDTTSKHVVPIVNADIVKVNTIIQSIQPIEHRLNQLIKSFSLAHSSSLDSFIANINPLRDKLEQLCVEALFTHLETACNLNIDTNHWRSCFHHLIETLRKEYNSLKHSTAPNLKQCELLSNALRSYITKGCSFYAKLIDKLEEAFLKFKCQELVDFNLLNNFESIKRTLERDLTIRSKNMKLALMCVNRCWIGLGDLARYEQMIFADLNTGQRDYSVARSFYLKAMSVAPKSPRAYHQLAILAVYTKRRLDACYYYFRCLEVSAPLTSVRQALYSLFDEARLRSDAIIQLIMASVLKKQKKEANAAMVANVADKNKHRVEIWFKPAFVGAKQRPQQKENQDRNSSDDEDEDDEAESSDDDDETQVDHDGNPIKLNEKKLSANELSKRFMLNYLNTVGKLFTKVGMETYQEVCSRMLHEFAELLKRQPCPLGKVRLLQISAINIALIDLIYKSSHSSVLNEETKKVEQQAVHRTQLLESAVQLSIDMFVLIVKRFAYLLNKDFKTWSSGCSREETDFMFSEQEEADSVLPSDDNWRHFLPSIKTFVDWMLCNSKLWQPLPDQLPPDLGPNMNRIQTLADMLNLVHKILNLSRVEVYDPNFLNRIRLEEDVELSGFVPLMSVPRHELNLKPTQQSKTNPALNDKIIELIRDRKRIEKLCLFADYLCGLEKPIMKYDVVNKCYAPPSQASSDVSVSRKEANRTVSVCSNGSVSSSKDETLLFLNEEGLVDSVPDEFDDLNELKEKRRVLKAKMDEQMKREKSQRSLLEMSAQRRLELEIRPKFIVPDTNCFVDHINLIERILATSYFILVVPLLVINELEKLGKSITNCNDDSIEHAEYVQRNAKKAIQYLNLKFEKRERNLKVLTSQGSVLETIQFRSEEVKAQGTNDELILGCCLHYCRDNARDFMPQNKTDAIHLYREVVLLTEDRHLRLKAHTRNVPVKNIIQFCKWSNLMDDRRSNTNTNSANNKSSLKKF